MTVAVLEDDSSSVGDDSSTSVLFDGGATDTSKL